MIKEIIAILVILIAVFVVFVSQVPSHLYVCQNDLTMVSGGLLFYGMGPQQMVEWCQFGKLLYYGSWLALIISVALFFVKDEGLSTILSIGGAIYLVIMLGSLALIFLPTTSLESNNPPNVIIPQTNSNNNPNLQPPILNPVTPQITRPIPPVPTILPTTCSAFTNYDDSGYWSFDDGTAIGIIGNAIEFNDNCWSANSTFSNSPKAKPTIFSAGGWFKTTSNAFALIDSMANRTVLQYAGWLIHIENGVANFRIGYKDGSGTETLLTGGSNLNDGAWHNVISTYDGTYMRLYIDGVLVGLPKESPSPVYNSKNYFMIGAGIVNGADWEKTIGIFDEIKLWNYALNENEIQELYLKK